MVTEFFDIAIAPSATKALAGVTALGGPNQAGIHIYLGGHRSVASGWTQARVDQFVKAGIRRYLLTWVGDQRSDQLGELRGAVHGRQAVEAAQELGWTRGAPLVLDIEAFTFDAKPDASLEYFQGWAGVVRESGHRAGLYSSTRALAAASQLPSATPDFAWAARWVGHERQQLDPRQIKGLSSAMFSRKGQRAWQYAGEMKDGTKRLRCQLAGMDVDLNVADDGLLVGPPGARPRLEALVPKKRNEDIAMFQRRLRKADGGSFAALNPDGATGFYGVQTIAMCRAFQKAQGWTGPKADGVAGVLTVARLFP